MEQQDSTAGMLDRLKITGLLAGIGALGGATAGVILTYLGNVISGYHIPPDIGIYAWNAGIMSAMGAMFGPPLAWSMLRNVPLWRTLSEPAAAGIAGSVLSMIFVPSLFPVVVPAAILAAAVRLKVVYGDVEPGAVEGGIDERPSLVTAADDGS